MKKFFILCLVIISQACLSQELTVTTIVKNINASGGLTIDKDGNIYVSDFGKTFTDTLPTKVFKVEKETWKVSTYAEGFKGASGVFMDSKGSLYQSNPKGGNVSLVGPSGAIDHTFATGLTTPVGVVKNSRGEVFVCECGKNRIIKVDKAGNQSVFSEGDFYACPNGITINEQNELFVVNFSGSNIVKLLPDGSHEILVDGLATLVGGPNPVGLGHITYSHGYLYATAIGRGQVYRVSMDGNAQIIAGSGQFSNTDGPAKSASFSKPNGIVASHDGDRLFINVSDPTWISNPGALHPAHLVMIEGICSLPDSNCTKK